MEYVNYENLGAESYNPDTEKQKGVRENMYRYTRNSSVIAALVLGYVAYKVKNPSTKLAFSAFSALNIINVIRLHLNREKLT